MARELLRSVVSLPIVLIPIALMPGGTVQAQIIPDATLPTNSITTTSGDTITITGGTPSGNHLFHSFDTFSIPTDQTVIFDHSPDLDALVTRVTGPSISILEGSLQTQGSTDFFLLNPNGILFGETAQLNVGGSFIASTADSLLFDNGTAFSATNPNSPPILTINTPIGLQYGDQTGEIFVDGSGHNLTIDEFTLEVITTNRPEGLTVNDGHTLALLGGPVTLGGGNVTAAAGRVIIGGVGSGGNVTLATDALGWTANFSATDPLEPVALENAASIVTSGNGGGSIHIAGQFVDVLDGSTLLANTIGNQVGNGILLQAAEELILAGVQTDNSTLEPLFPSSVFSEVEFGATGSGGLVELSAPFISISDGAYVSTSTFDSGNGGDISVRAAEIELIGGTSTFGPSGFFLDVNEIDATGNGGNFSLTTEQLTLANGANIAANTFGLGSAGQIDIVASSIDVIGGSADLGSSSIVSAVEGGGNGATIRIDSDDLSVTDGAEITLDVFGSGDGGAIAILADTIVIDGTSPSGNFASNISATVQATGDGRGGTISLDTRQLTVAAGAEITSETFSASRQGQAGDITIDADAIELIGIDNQPTGIFASVGEDLEGNIGQGDGGELTIQTNQLLVREGAQVVVGTLGAGDAQSLTITANTITLDGTNNQASSGLFANALMGTGAGGDIVVSADALVVQNGATINASNFSSTDTNIAPGQGAAGNILITANSTQLRNQGSLTTSTFTGDRGNIRLNSDQILLRNNSTITTNASQTATGGNISILSDFLIAVPTENSDITANAQQGQGGRIEVTTQGILGLSFPTRLTSNSDITASSDIGLNGEIIINLLTSDPSDDLTPLPDSLLDTSDQITTGCPADTGASFVATGRGGLPTDPTQTLIETVLSQSQEGPGVASLSLPSTLLTEATHWNLDTQGQVQLLSQAQAVALTTTTCQGGSKL